MTADTPAARLAKAAEKLRTLAQAATPGPWSWREEPGAFGPIGYVDVPLPGQDASRGLTPFLPLQTADAETCRYIAALHPGLALLLAELLSASSADWEQLAHHNATTMDGHDHPEAADDSMECALALADVILREEP